MEALKIQALENGKTNGLVFGGTKSYPDEFINAIREYDVMLLTKLNDKQPRLIFDSISQGVIPICPKSNRFQATKLGEFIYYKRISSEGPAEKSCQFINYQNFADISDKLHNVASSNTIDTMLRSRADWIKKTIDNIS